MKQLQNTSIFLFFLIIFLFQNNIESFKILNIKEPIRDNTTQILYQNALEDLKKMEKSFQIDFPEDTTKIYSKMLYRDPFNFFDQITILKGENDQIKTNAAVVNEQGLIGTVFQIEKNKSHVRLLTNSNSVVSVKIKDFYGIMNTNQNKECWIENLTKESKLEIEDEVVTSGLTDIPANILVGTIEEIQTDELGLTKKAKVKINADLNDISYVTILRKGEYHE